MQQKYKLGFIGAGNMARAIAKGVLSGGLLSADQILMTDVAKGSFEGIEITDDNSRVLQNCQYVILAIKPQVFDNISDSFCDIQADAIISIMAGKSVQKIRSATGIEQVVRVMPNFPCMIGKGMAAIAINDYPKPINDFVLDIFNSVGKAVFLPESLFDTVTSISGSGPAYVYYFIQAMTNAGVEGGLSFEDSLKLTLQTFEGAVKMVEQSTIPIDTMIDNVCSKGGTTIEAIKTFRQQGVDQAIQDGIRACKNRSEELSK
ncbi:MAG: pyrroline-5-carboxylate reductase [Christensenellales bacterium]